jgi:glucan biosynthesis protein C
MSFVIEESEMAQITMETTEKSTVQAVAEKVSRLFFIDHLRAALVILVVLHHVAMVYGASSPFYYAEPPFTDPAAFRNLLLFALFNQAWFMGAFFLLAGYFSPGSYDRKGPGSFLKDRLIRLGIPLIVFYFVLSPISSIGFWLMPAALTGITTPLTWQVYPDLLGLGIAWFLAMLLIFSIGYAAWRWLTRNRPTSSTSESLPPSYLGIGIFILALALLSYLLRIVVPLGRELFGFPTIAYLPQYLTFFAIGAVAYRHNWFRTVPGSMGVVGFVVAVVATVILLPLALSGSFFSLEISDPATFVGNSHWQSAVYAVWDSIFAVGLCLAAITFFRRFFNEQSAFGSFLSEQSYAVFLIHVPIVVFVAYALRGIALAAMPKFILVSAIVVPICFAVAYVIRKIPGVSRVI